MLLKYAFKPTIALILLLALLHFDSASGQQAWRYDTLFVGQAFDCFETDKKELLIASKGGIVRLNKSLSISDTCFFHNRNITATKFFELDNQLCFLGAGYNVHWIHPNFKFTETKILADGQKLTGIQDIFESKYHYIILGAENSEGKKDAAFIYYIEKDKFSPSTDSCHLNKSAISGYRGYGKTNKIVTQLNSDYLLADDGVFRVEAEYKEEINEGGDRVTVFEKYDVVRSCPNTKKRNVTCAIELNDGSAYLTGDGLWLQTQSECISEKSSPCYDSVSLKNIRDIELYDNHVWMVSEESGIVAYNLQERFFQQDEVFKTYSIPALTTTSHGLILSTQHALVRVEPIRIERKPATVILLGINGHLKHLVQKNGKRKSWEVLREVIKMICIREDFNNVYLLRFPKDAELISLFSEKELDRILSQMNKYFLEGHTDTDPREGERIWTRALTQVFESLKSSAHKVSSLRLITISNGRDKFEDIEPEIFSLLKDSCAFDVSLNVLSAVHGNPKLPESDSLLLSELALQGLFDFENFQVNDSTNATKLAEEIFGCISPSSGDVSMKPKIVQIESN